MRNNLSFHKRGEVDFGAAFVLKNANLHTIV